MRKMKSAALAILLASCATLRADGNVLEKLPAGSLMAGRVTNLAATSAKVAKLAKELGIDAFLTNSQNLLGYAKIESGVSKGINDAGDLGVSFVDAKSLGLKDDESFVVLVPVTTYAEFLSNFAAPKTEGDVSEVTMPAGPQQTLYVADWGGYAAISPAKVMVAKPSVTLKLTDSVAKESARQDFLFVSNFKELRGKLLPELDKGTAQAMAELEKSDAKDLDPKYKPLIKAAITQAFAAAKTFLNNADDATFGLNLSNAGINTTLMAGYTPDSYLGKVAVAMKGTDKPLTLGLPALKYLAYGGATFDTATSAQVFDDLTKPILAELEKIEGADQAKKLAATATSAFKKLTGTTFGMTVPAAVGKEALIQQVAVYHGGSAEFKTLFGEGSEFAKQLVATMKLPPDRPKPVIEQTANVKTIEGVSFDRIRLENKLNPDAPGAAQQEQMQAIFYGPEGIAYQYGVAGDDFFVVNGASDETVAAFIKANKAREDNIAKLDYVKVVSAELPKSRSLEYFVALDEMVNIGVSTAAQFGLPIQIQLPPELPPLGVTFGADGPNMRVDTHLATTTLQSLIAAGMQAFMGMRGGGGGNL